MPNGHRVSYYERRPFHGCGSPKATKMGNGERLSEFYSWRNGMSFGLIDLQALLTAAREAKEWITAHTVKR